MPGGIVGLIPARGGSVSIPRKCLAPLDGRPLIVHTIEAALASERLDRVFLSTDDEEIAAVARAAGLEVPWLRPADLAADDTAMIDVVADALDRLGDVEVLVLLQPTSPLRGAEHIDAVVDALQRDGADTVVTTVRVPHQFSPPSIFREEAGRLIRYDDTTARPTRRQDKPSLLAANGPAVLAVRPAVVRTGTLYGPLTVGVEMTALESIDIDGPDDLLLAELLLAARANGRP